MTKAVHDAGSVIFCQLWHCGRASHSDFMPEGVVGPVAPSAIAISEESGFTAHTPSGKKPFEVQTPAPPCQSAARPPCDLFYY